MWYYPPTSCYHSSDVARNHKLPQFYVTSLAWIAFMKTVEVHVWKHYALKKEAKGCWESLDRQNFSDGEGSVCCGREELRWLGSGRRVCCKAEILSDISAFKFSISALVTNNVPPRQVTVSVCIPWLTNFVGLEHILWERGNSLFTK